jgi:hypothetical protein
MKMNNDNSFDLNEATPSQLGVALLNQYFGEKSAYRLLLLANSGTHRGNPYHNVRHCLSVVYHAIAAADTGDFPSTLKGVAVDTMSSATRRNLILASLFHDHSHSGGVYPDYDNIKVAMDFVSAHSVGGEGVFADASSIRQLIRVTEYVYPNFTATPESFAECCIRDADLCAVYSHEGRASILDLYAELGKIKVGEPITQEFVDSLLESNTKFLREAKMYTKYGQHLKATQLTRSLDQLEEMLQYLVNNSAVYAGAKN